MVGDYKNCKRCQRARWLMVFVMLVSMSAVLYLNHFAI